MARFSVPLPRLPPTMNRCLLSGFRPKYSRPSALWAADAGCDSTSRMGFPLITILSAGKNFSMPSYATQIFEAFFPRILFVSPAKPFCSWMREGIPILVAAINRGALA